jgi:hypothetical protein
MLLSLLAYVLLGLVLALPLRSLLRWLGPRSGLYTPQWRYLRPYVPAARRSPTPLAEATPEASASGTTTQSQETA